MTRPLPPIAPCPRPGCKKRPNVVKIGRWFYVACNREWCGPLRATERGAILAWNRRSDAEAERRGAMAVADWVDKNVSNSWICSRVREAINRGEVLPSAPEPSKKKARRT